MRIDNILIIASAIILLVAFFNRNELPSNIEYVPAIVNEPVQKKTGKRAFDLSYENVEYRIAPEYE